MSDSRIEVEAGERFAFGGNWRAFLALVDDARIQTAEESLADALGTDDLSGRTFLDAGCGSGLFSLAAVRLGAQVRSFDYDHEAVTATNMLRRRFASRDEHDRWCVEQGSLLDEGFVAGLGRFDVVYSWGVLHHTGDMWKAMANVAALVLPGGLLHISVYNDQGRASRVWWHVKRRYNRSGPFMRRLLVLGSTAYLGRRLPLSAVLRALHGDRPGGGSRPRRRGMSFRHDLLDWVGGFPFEVAKPEEVFQSLHSRGFALRHLRTCGGGLGCNEYVFQRVPSPETGA